MSKISKVAFSIFGLV